MKKILLLVVTLLIFATPVLGVTLTTDVNGLRFTRQANEGEVIKLEYKSNEEGIFSGWQVTDATGNNISSIEIDATKENINFLMPNCDIIAKAVISYNLRTNATNIKINGKIVNSSDGNIFINKGSNVWLNVDNIVGRWKTDGLEGEFSGNPITFTMPANNVTALAPYSVELEIVDDETKIVTSAISGEMKSFLRVDTRFKDYVIKKGNPLVTVATLTGNKIRYLIPDTKLQVNIESDDEIRLRGQPVSQNVLEGESVDFSVIAGGKGAINYQWYYKLDSNANGEAIIGANESIYRIENTTCNMDGIYYYCVVSNGSNSITSNTALLNVYRDERFPNILENPQAQVIVDGEDATFEVTASGENLTYQWYYNQLDSNVEGISINGATNSTYQIMNATGALNNRYYYCTVTNEYATKSSRTALLNVCGLPIITRQPQGTNAEQGSGAEFSVEAEGNGVLGYQWYYNESNSNEDGELIEGAISSTYSIANVDNSMNGRYYYCKVTNTILNKSTEKLTNVALLSVGGAPRILTQPTKATVLLGEEATFTIRATGTGTLSYQWYYNQNNSNQNGELILGANQNTYTTEVTNINMNGRYYYCIVTNTVEEIGIEMTTNTAMLRVVTKPTITTQPISQTVAEGEDVIFSVVATGGGTLSYQWYYDKEDLTKCIINEATSSSYTIEEVNSIISGRTYYCEVKDTINGVYEIETSNKALLTVMKKPNITQQPVSQIVWEGDCATFSIIASITGNGTLSYQWYDNLGIIASATSSSYRTPAARADMNGKTYHCKVTNTVNGEDISVVSEIATLGVITNPIIGTQPVAQTVANGNTATFSITATGATSYQWYYNETDSTENSTIINNATSSSYTTEATTSEMNGRYYYCVASNSGGSTTSNTALLTVQLLLSDAVSVGDYVNYQAGTGYSYISTSTKSGYSANQTFSSNSSKNDIKWRVLSVDNEANTVTLISADVIQKEEGGAYILNGANGAYWGANRSGTGNQLNNGNQGEIEKICAIYGNGAGATGARGLTREEIDTLEGIPTTYSYSSIFNELIRNDEDEMQGTYGDIQSVVSEEYPNGNGTTNGTATITTSLLAYNGTKGLNSNSDIYKLLFKDSGGANNIAYWLTTPSDFKGDESYYGYYGESWIDWGVSYVHGGKVNPRIKWTESYGYKYRNGLYSTYEDNNTEYDALYIRPVVTLQANLLTSGQEIINEKNMWTLGSSIIVPSITSQPGSKIVITGNSATFSVTADNATGYQWYYNTTDSNSDGTIVSGATSSSYTISSTTTEMNGRYYFCVVTGQDGDTRSNTAKLTVSATGVTLASMVSIGDYVNYQAGTGHSYISTSTKSGHSANQTFKSNSENSSNDDIKWRVLSVDNETNTVTLISADVIEKEEGGPYILNGANGAYWGTNRAGTGNQLNNGNQGEIEKICAIYGNGAGATGARGLTREEIDTLEGIPTTYSYSSIFNDMRNNDETRLEGTYGDTQSTSGATIPNGAGTTMGMGTITTSLLAYNGTKGLNADSDIYKLLFKDHTGDNNIAYWLTTPSDFCVNYWGDWIGWGVSYVHGGKVNPKIKESSGIRTGLYTPYDAMSTSYDALYIRPVVTLQASLLTSGQDGHDIWQMIN